MIDLDEILYRWPLETSFSLVLRAVPAHDVKQVAESAADILDECAVDGEIILTTERKPTAGFPARIRGRRTRVVVSDNPASGDALSEAFTQCRFPVVLTADPDSLPALSAAECMNLVERVAFGNTSPLNAQQFVQTKKPDGSQRKVDYERVKSVVLSNHDDPEAAWETLRIGQEIDCSVSTYRVQTYSADVAVGRRRATRTALSTVVGVLLAGWVGGFAGAQAGWPLTGCVIGAVAVWTTLQWGFLFGVFLGVSARDPLCPVKAMRLAAVKGMVLQTSGKLVELELLAKLTFMTCLFDEEPISVPSRPGEMLTTLCRQFPSVFNLIVHPEFWRLDSVNPVYRPAQNALAESRGESTRAPSLVPHFPVSKRQRWGARFPKSQWRDT